MTTRLVLYLAQENNNVCLSLGERGVCVLFLVRRGVSVLLLGGVVCVCCSWGAWYVCCS